MDILDLTATRWTFSFIDTDGMGVAVEYQTRDEAEAALEQAIIDCDDISNPKVLCFVNNQWVDYMPEDKEWI